MNSDSEKAAREVVVSHTYTHEHEALARAALKLGYSYAKLGLTLQEAQNKLEELIT